MLNHVSLFAGIGGLDLGLHTISGLVTTAVVEQDPYCRDVLRLRFPGAAQHVDVRDFEPEPGMEVDVLSAGFPCQDISLANHRAKGLDGARSGLWSEVRRIAEESRPRFVVVENSPALVRRGLAAIVSQMGAIGYRCEASRIYAQHIGAPHRRDRLFIIASRDGGRPPSTDRQGGTWTDLSTWTGGRVATWRAHQWQPRPVDQWPTLTAASYGSNRGGSAGRDNQRKRPSLTALANQWPTLTARDGSRGAGWDRPGRPLSERVGGPLNPAWCELFMGFPMGWTDLDCPLPESLPFPAGLGPYQHPYEPPRLVRPRSMPLRKERVRALGNAVLPPVAGVVAARLAEYIA